MANNITIISNSGTINDSSATGQYQRYKTVDLVSTKSTFDFKCFQRSFLWNSNIRLDRRKVLKNDFEREIQKNYHIYVSVDVDECSTLNGGCSQQCHNIEKSYYCTCNQGFTLHYNQRSCIGKKNICLKPVDIRPKRNTYKMFREFPQQYVTGIHWQYLCLYRECLSNNVSN